MIYLDHNATNPIDPRLLEVHRRALEDGWANPSSPHAAGRRARGLVEEAREQVARLLGVAPGQVTFTSTGSEALNQALASAAPPGAVSRILASAVEHQAVREALGDLERVGRARCAGIAVDRQGVVEVEAFRSRLVPGVALVALIAAQNETGVLQPVREVGAACAAARVPFLVDAVQALGRLRQDWAGLPWDWLVLSAHKLRAPRGAAALVHRGRAGPPRPLVWGGGQELGRRAGTESVAAIAALGAACELLRKGELFDPDALRVQRDRFEAALLARIPGAEVVGQSVERLPQTTMLLVPGGDAEAMLAALDLAGVAASTGSACSSGALETSHVLTAMGIDAARAKGRLRLSFGPETTAEELERAVELIAKATGAA